MSSSLFVCTVILLASMGCTSKHSEHPESRDEVDMESRPTNQYVISQVATTKPSRHGTTQSFVVNGRVSYDQNKISNISARVSGRIEELYVQYQYQPIKKGQKLLALYSRELETEQENYLYVLRNDPANTTLIESIENRLHLLGMTMEQRATLVSSNNASRSLVR